MRRAFVVICLAVVAACGGGGNNNKIDGGGSGDAMGSGDDAGVDAPPMQTEVTCEVLPPVASGTCEVTPGGTTKLIKGTVLTPTTVYHGGQVAVDATGVISCVGCDCAQGGETTIVCPDGAISPGLINTHDHITFTQDNPYNDTGERYEHRHQWRTGSDGHTKIPSQGSATADQIRWGELRFLMGGATSIVGSGGQKGLLRNLDQAANMEGLQKKAVDFDTFPLDDSNGTRRTADCNYGPSPTTAASLANIDAYEPHTSEGIDRSARNEFLCESSTTYDTMTPGVSDNLVLGKTSMIHAIGLVPADLSAMATAHTGLIWSPRSNITLYGDTARVSTAARLGVNIALGTDWMPTGSMNLLRELKCADQFNTTYLGQYFNDEQLWQMVTANAATATKTEDSLGLLAPGRLADISIFAAHGKTYRAVIDAEPQDVVLVMRAGTTLYGDNVVVGGLTQAACDAVDVCGTMKSVCLMGEIGKTYSALKTGAGASIYPAFACGTPMNEPSCQPKRPTSVNGSSIYTGEITAADSDGDGTPDATDKCPHVFDPIRPLDQNAEADADNDGVGDACDPCPLDPNTTTCKVFDPNDRDSDGVLNSADNCPDNANTNQADADMDGKGDVCDACPTDANPGSAGCPVSIYNIKNGTVPVGSVVRVQHALVTGKGSNGFFAQVKEGDANYMGADYSGLFVFTGANSPLLANVVAGARVTVDGSVDVFVGETEIDNVTALTVESTGEAPPAPIMATYAEVATGGSRAVTLESVLVTLGPATVTAQNAQFGEFTLTSNTTNLVVDDFIYAQPTTIGQSFGSATGVLATKSAGGGVAVSKLHPRSAADLPAGAPALTSLLPATTFARAGVSGNTIPSTLTVSLSGPAQGDTTVMLMSGDTNSLTVNNVTIMSGQTSAVVPVTGVAQSADVAVMAMLGMQMQIAHVRVLGATEAPTTATLSPATATVAPNGSTDFTVTLDIPAPPGGATVNLSATQGTVPATVTVAADQMTATFTYTDTVGSGNATISADVGGAPSTAMVTVNVPVTGHLVINEVDYDQIGADTAEFVEIYNPTTTDISLANLALSLVNGSNNQEYARVDLSSATSVPAGGYLVVAPATVTVPTSAKKVTTTWNNIVQNGSPDGIALIDTSNSTVIDRLSYEGAMTMCTLPGFANPVSLVEGTALATTVADSNTTDGSLCRSPNGSDTDNANADWVFCTTLTVGTANP